jgi:hypothetical protein
MRELEALQLLDMQQAEYGMVLREVVAACSKLTRLVLQHAVTDYPEECFRRGCASGGEGLALLPAGACSQHAAGPACAWLPGWSRHRTWQPWWACPRCARSCVMRLTCRAWHIVFDYDDADMAWETTRACVEERLQESMEVMQQQGVVVSELVSSMQEDYRDESLRLLVDFKVKGVAVHCLV